MLYRIRELVKAYASMTVLDLKALDVEEGRIIGLMGPNGAGKTTLLEILAFLQSPTKGTLWYGQIKVDGSQSHIARLRREVVLVQQQPVLFTTTVKKNVEFPLKIRRVPRIKRERIVDELLAIVRMDGFIEAKANTLSVGETHRVAIARALACSPKVILMDEPTASVDVENQSAIEGIIKEINRAKGISVVFTTHNVIQASRLADNTVFLYKGKVARSVYENIFSGTIETGEDEQKYCVLTNGLRFKIRFDRVGQVQISIDPNEITVNRDGHNASQENVFKGTLVQLTVEVNWVRALIDVGVAINVLVPKDQCKDLLPDMGGDVWITCPTGSIQVFQ